MAYVVEPEKRVSVLYDADVVVAGGGVAGVFAAVAAARNGARTVIVDRFGSVGGNIGPGMIAGGGLLPGTPHPKAGMNAAVERSPFGIPREFIHRYAEHGGGRLQPFGTNPRARIGDAELASYVAQTMLEEEGVTLLLSVTVGDPVMDGGLVRGVFVETKSGRGAVLAKVTVDATGEADVAMRAGAPMLHPKQEYHALDPHSPNGVGLHYVIGGIDAARWRTFHESARPSEDDLAWGKAAVRGLGVWMPLLGVLRKEVDAGGDVPSFTISVGGVTARADMGVFRTNADVPDILHGRVSIERLDTIDVGNPIHVSAMEAGLRRHVVESVLFLRKHAPGFENAGVIATAPYLGARGGRCIEGEHVLTMDDCLAGRLFDDVVYRYGEARALKKTAEAGEPRWVDFPYRAMIPKGIDGVIAAGRCASGIPDTIVRNRWAVMTMGEVAGTAAALAARHGVVPRALDYSVLQRALLDAGFYLGSIDRLKALRLV